MKKQILSTFIITLFALGTQVFAMQNGSVDSVYIVGSATSGGWDLASQTMMTQSEVDTNNVFIYSDTLKAGEFKIKLYPAEDFCAGDWLHPLTADQALNVTDAIALAGCAEDNPDYKWIIKEAGEYTVTADLNDTTVSITLDQSFEISYDSLFLVGDATPAGWDLANQVAMTAVTDDGSVFTWSGTLKTGELKIKTYAEQDFCAGEWIHPPSESAGLEINEFEILVGCASTNPDYKWVVAEKDTGIYTISVDIDSMTITFEKTSSTSNEDRGGAVTEYRLMQNYPNPFNPSTKIEFNLPQSGQVKVVVYNVLGKEIKTLVNQRMSAGTHSVSFDAANLSSGIYIYRLITPSSAIAKKMLLLK